jgi:DnaJ-class molecular chaperone
MTVDSATLAGAAGQSSTCPHCGGSGTLRLSGQRYRTCLPCLGQGRTPALESAITTAKLAALRAEALRDATELTLNAVASAAAAK